VHVFDNGVTSSLDSSVVFAPVITLGVQTTITLDASKGGSADFASITETVVTPEPAYALPAALCLAVIALRRRLASEIHKTQRCPDDRNQR
jgi:hypothetical protein